MGMRKSTGLACVALVCAGLGIAVAIGAGEIQEENSRQTVVKIVAQRFSYTPHEIILRKGQAAVLEFKSLDFMHGFTIPDLGIRADLPPGQVTRVRLTPEKSGVFEFLCDNFCGAGHEHMNGRIIVRE